MLRCSLGILALCVACGPTGKTQAGTPDTAKPAALIVDRTSVQFATVSPGEISAEAAVRISNVGGSASEALVTALDGADAASFVVTSDGCRAAVLAPAFSCEMHLAFHPSEERQFSAQLRVASGASAATVSLSAAAEGGARLSLTGSTSFSGVELGSSATRSVKVSNVGRGASAPLSIARSGDAASFTVSGNCEGRALAAGDSCELEVLFAPRQLGPAAFSLDISGGRFASAHGGFDGYGQRRVTLTISVDGAGQVAVDGSAQPCGSALCQLAFEIGGPVQNVMLKASPGADTLFGQWSGGCSGTALSCALVIDGDRSVVARFVPAVSVTLEGQSVAGGTGVIALEAGPSCNAACRTGTRVPRGSRLRLSASAASGSQVRWTSGCSGAELACELTANGDISASVAFVGANYVFVTSKSYPSNLGIAAYDAACNERARVAGLPGTYVAWMSTSRAAALSRIGSAQGFIRVDGRPFADRLGGVPVFYPPALDEFGALSGSQFAMTGSDSFGQLAAGENCSDWTDPGSSSALSLGNPFGGAGAWSAGGGSNCPSWWPIYCVGTAVRRPLQAPSQAGRLAFVSSGTTAATAGTSAADALCAKEAREAGLAGSFKALLAVEGASAASRFDPHGAAWVRTDGVAIVEQAADLGKGRLLAPIDVTAFGAYDFGNTMFSTAWVWTGAFTPGMAGTADSTCKSWTSASADLWGYGALVNCIGANLGFFGAAIPCTFGAYRVYCLQE